VEALELDPHLPPGWRRLSLRIAYRGIPLVVSMTPDEIVIEARTATVPVRVGDLEADVVAGAPLRLARAGGGWRTA
jgi:trehalose/maltose hydrolase-like predicted phosphorylase